MRSVLVPLLLLSAAACSSVERPTLSLDDVPTAREERAAPTPANEASAPASMPRVADGVGRPYTMIRLGALEPHGDIDLLDTGFWGDVAFGREILTFLAIEGSVGYFQAEGSAAEIWGIPLFVNGRVSVPVLVFEPYAGGGVGMVYADYDGFVTSGSDWVPAWNAFIGVQVGLGRLAVGGEYRYIQTDEVDDRFAIEGSQFSLLASLPF